MNHFQEIQNKLQSFLKKYYTNEIIKGSILFMAFGLLFFLGTLIVEYFLWLKPLPRTVLFWTFIVVELSLLINFIIIPTFKLIGLKRGISLEQASAIIGNHFQEVEDKLLNILQLQESEEKSDLILASIEQKAAKLQPIPFREAVNFKTNKKYIKYLLVPLFLWLVIFISDNDFHFNQSLDRVVHHKMAYTPPAPFQFIVENKELSAIEGEDFTLHILMQGDVIPEEVKINYNGQSYFLQEQGNGNFSYEFTNLNSPINFDLEANGFLSMDYLLKVVATPRILNFKMLLDYPKYTHKKQETILNTGNAVVPEGTKITWVMDTKNTKNIHFTGFGKDTLANQIERNKENEFLFHKTILNSVRYQVSTSNLNLKHFEKLQYNLEVIKDAYPKILVKSDIDSVKRGPVQFLGQLSDDYLLTKLEVKAKNLRNNEILKHSIPISKSDFEKFFYVFPNGFQLDEGAAYEIYFEVFDNDQIHGSKKTKSATFNYFHKTKEKINEELLEEQNEEMSKISEKTKEGEELQKRLDKLSDKLKNTNQSNWMSKKEMDAFLKRQKKYQEMLRKNTDNLLQNLNESEQEKNETLEQEKQALKDRIEESKELLEKEDLLQELQELTEKLKKEDLLDKLDKLSQQTKQETKSLERILELTKRFYMEKKSDQIANRLDSLSKEQNNLSEQEHNSAKAQERLNKKFDSIQQDFKELEKMNKGLKQPKNLPNTKPDTQLIEMEMQEAKESLDKESSGDNKAKDQAKKKQKSAAKKMQELKQKMEKSKQQMEMEGLDEDIKNLQQILENLILFSLEQEDLMLSLENVEGKNANYPQKLKKQQLLKNHFEHVDDSLYTLSLRMVQMSSKIQKDLTDAHYNIDKSLENIAENRIKKGISNQRYTMTAANNLADMLSSLLQSLQNKKPGNGEGKGKGGEELSLPDIIKKQSELLQKAKEGSKPQEGGKSPSKEQLSGEQYQIYQEQNELRSQLKQLMKEGKGNNGKKALQQMEELEQLLLEKGLQRDVEKKMQDLEYELLKLDEAQRKQGEDKKRTSKTNTKEYQRRVIDQEQMQKLFFNQQELLERQQLPLQTIYKEKVKKYFEVN